MGLGRATAWIFRTWADAPLAPAGVALELHRPDQARRTIKGEDVERTHISQLFADMDALGGTAVTVAGWVRSVRDMKNFGFVMLSDGSCFKDLQVVMNRESLANYDEIAATGVFHHCSGYIETCFKAYGH